MNRIHEKTLVMLLALISCVGGAMAAPSLISAYDWSIEIETSQLDRQFEYQGSVLKPVQKTEISFNPADDPNDKKEYEYIWFKNGQPLGMERKNKLDLPQGEGIEIKVKHKDGTPTYAEYKAAANAIERIYLDAYLNKNPVEIVDLPTASFGPIVNELLGRNWAVLSDATDVALDATLNLHLKAKDGTKKTLYYVH